MAALGILIVLNYSNASSALPVAFKNPDWDFLAMILVATATLCIAGFLGGWFLPALVKTSEPERKSLMFGLGMNNNGTALVLASTALPDHPLIMLPIIFYNLGQQVVAGIFSAYLEKHSQKTVMSDQ